MSNILTFQYMSNGEFGDYYYEIIGNDGYGCGTIEYDGDEWIVDRLYWYSQLNWDELIQIANKLLKLNAATKSDKLFGFL